MQVYHWAELPRHFSGAAPTSVAAFRSDDCLLTFNWVQASSSDGRAEQHPFDQIILTIEGRQRLHVDGRQLDLGPQTVARIPPLVPYQLRAMDGPVLFIAVFAPPHPGYLPWTHYQSEYSTVLPQTAATVPLTAAQELRSPAAAAPIAVYPWIELPRVTLVPKLLERAVFRGNGSNVSFNWFSPQFIRRAPHSHPFDQTLMITEGRLAVELEGEVLECGPKTILHIPADAMHAAWPLGDGPVVNLDIFAPARADHLFQTTYQRDCFAPAG